MQHDMLERARAHRDTHTYDGNDLRRVQGDHQTNKPGFVKAMWCGDQACEDKIKEEYDCNHPAACRSIRSSCPTPVFAAASLQRRWYTRGEAYRIPQADVSKEAGRDLVLEQTEELSLCSDSGKKDGNTMKKCFIIRNIWADSSRAGPKRVNTSETL